MSTPRLIRNTLILLALLLLTAGLALAGELRITDHHGLTRAIKDIGQNASVLVKARGEAPTLSITNVDGLAAELSASKDKKSGAFVFQGVSEGTWQIKPQEGVRILKVEIKSQ